LKSFKKTLIASVTLLFVKIFEKKVHYLVRTVDKLSKDKSNFENVLASQNCVFGKTGLGFNPQNKQGKFSKSFLKLPEKTTDCSVETTGCYMLLLHEKRSFCQIL